MKIKDLKNTKIYLPNEDDRVRFQKKVFKLGVEWKAGEPRKLMGREPFYYIDSNLKLTFDYSSYQVHFFLECKDKQIFLDEVLSIAGPKEEPRKKCKFKPFDKVLVVNNSNVWVFRFFSKYSGKDTHRFETTDGSCYKTCIPYEGNEHLVGKLKINDYTRTHK